jgi:hypothetical protein
MVIHPIAGPRVLRATKNRCATTHQRSYLTLRTDIEKE